MARDPKADAGGGASAVAERYRTGRVLKLAIVAALGGFLFGFDSAVVNGAKQAIEDKFNLVNDDIWFFSAIGLVVSVALLGSAVGAWFAGPLANKYGRRRVMVIAAALFLVAAFGQGFPFGVYDLVLWRFVGGAGIGVASVIAPMYIAEVAPAALRGRLGSLQQLAIVTGIFTSALTNYVLLNAAGGESANAPLWGLEAWQWMFLVMVIPAVVYGGLALRIPESPRYLVSIGKDEEAAEILGSIIEGDQHGTVAEIKQTLAGEHKPRFRDLRGAALGLHPIVWIGIGLSVFQQFVGINVIFYYSNTIWSSVGLGESEAFLITLITNTTNVVVTFVAIALVDKIGRKPLLLIGSVGMAVSLAAMAVIFATGPTCTQAILGTVSGCDQASEIGEIYLPGIAGPAAVVFANLYVVFFGVAWGPVVWVLLGEMFPNRLRAAALGVAAAAQWIANFIVSETFPTLAERGLGFAYGIYTVMAVLSFFFVVKFIKETKGKSLESMTG
ncbi:MAG: sugar porter family MFS transporter [Candidatus Nanopelagicales bacterium]|nr:sugar porter family MFS transporter [Candidatus Nanopelagicales bacterium]